MNIIKVLVQNYFNIKNFSINEVRYQFRDFRFAQKKGCFNNSFLYLCEQPEKQSMKYVLGYLLVDNMVPVEHALVKIGDEYFDVTPRNRHRADRYIAVLEVDVHTAAAFVNAEGYAPDIYGLNRFLRGK